MAKIVDPGSLSVYINGVATDTGQEVVINREAKTIQLRISGNLDDNSPGKTSGVTAKSLYSFLKEEWLGGAPDQSAHLRRYKFPLKMIFEGSFIWTNGWAPADDQTRDLIRDAGFQEGVTSDEYVCFVSLGSVTASTDQMYYTQQAGFTSTIAPFDKTGELNENVLVVDNGLFDYSDYFKAYLRLQGKTYAEYDLLIEQGLSALNFQAYSFPMVNGTDLNVSQTDVFIDGNAPYTGMTVDWLQGVGFNDWSAGTTPPHSVVRDTATPQRWWYTVAGGTSAGDASDLGGGSDTGVTWVAYLGERDIGGVYYPFNRIVDCNGATNVQVYEWMQRQLRLATDINDNNGAVGGVQRDFGSVNGEVAPLMGEFVGADLKIAPGVFLDNFNATSTNDIQHNPITPNTGGLDSYAVPLFYSEVAFPVVATGTVYFSSNLVAEDPDSETFFVMYYDYITSVTSTGLTITGASGANCTFDYTGDTTLLDHLTSTTGGADDSSADYISVSGFTTNPENNGLYIVAGDPTTNTVAVTKVDGVNPTNDVTGESVTVKENPFESPSAIIVNDSTPAPITGNVVAGYDTTGYAFLYDLTGNNDGGRNDYYGNNSPAAIRVVAQALDTAEWVEATGTISGTPASITLNAGDERNYQAGS